MEVKTEKEEMIADFEVPKSKRRAGKLFQREAKRRRHWWEQCQ